MITTRHLFPIGERRGDTANDRLSQAWQAIIEGRGSKEDADLAMADLAEYTGYFMITPDDASDAKLRLNEGRRSVLARILFLLDAPQSYMTELRRASLDELQVSNSEGAR